MKTVEMAEATASLSDYAREAQKETLVVTRKGKPVLALMPLPPDTDLENLLVTTHPTFQGIIQRSEMRSDRGRALNRTGPAARGATRRSSKAVS